MTPEQLRKQALAKLGEAKALNDQWAGKSDAPADIDTKINGLLGESDVLKAKADQIERMEKGITDLEQPAATPVAWRQAGHTEGDAVVDEKSWHEYTTKNMYGVEQTIRYKVPLAVSRDAKQAKAYANAFEAYIRVGVERMKYNYPSDVKALSEGTDTAGGFLIPQDFHAELIKKQAAMVAVRNLARIVNTSRDVATWPRVNYGSATDDASGKLYTSPVRMNWTGESPATAAATRVTDQVFGQINIPVHTALATQLISMDLIEDSAFDVMGYTSEMFAESFTLGENTAFLNGNGSAKPMGLLTQVDSTDAQGNYIGPQSFASGTSGAISTTADSYSGKRLVDMFYNLPIQYRAQATWVLNSLTMAQIEALVDAQKRPLIGALTGISLASGVPDTIKGKPVMFDEFVPDVAASALPIIIGDWKGYNIVDRVGFSVQRNDMLYMETNFSLILGRKRVGGHCVEPYRFRVLKCA